MFSQETFKDLFIKRPSKIGYFKRYFLCLRGDDQESIMPVCCHVSLIISIPPTSPVPAWSLSLLLLSRTVITRGDPSPASILRNPVSSIIFKSGLDLGRRNLTGADTKILFVKHQMKINCLIR